jgi:alkaline phosphatase D
MAGKLFTIGCSKGSQSRNSSLLVPLDIAAARHWTDASGHPVVKTLFIRLQSMGWRRRPEHGESAKGRRAKTLFIQVLSVYVQMMVGGGFVFAQVLTHGPVVGGVTSSKASVFLRTDQEASVALCYGTDPNLDTCQMSETYQTRTSHDFTKIIRLSGLMPDNTFYLNIVVNAVPQLTSPPYPSFTTFPTAGSLRNFNFVVLTDFQDTYILTNAVQTYASAAAEHPAFAFIGGDFDHRNPRTLLAKRRMFKDLYDANTPYMGDFVNLILHQMPIIHQWDDHDAGMDDVDKTYADWNLTQQVFEEYVPRYPLPSITPGIWQKFRYAQADFFVLDCRSQRDPKLDPDDANKSMLDGNNLGTAGQLQWLEDGLRSSTARWKIIFTSVVTNPTTKFHDGWAGYQTEWNSLKNFINRNNIQGVVFISGDLHLGAIDNGVQTGFPEMCVIQPNNTGGNCPTSAFGVWSEGYYQDNCTGYGLVKILQNPDRLVLQVKDEYGNRQIAHTVR